jgi:hypothetical protein
MPAVSATGAQGTGLISPPIQLLNTMNAITQKYIVPILGDTVLIPSPALWAMTRLGKKFSGGELVYPIYNQEELTGGAYVGDQLLDTTVIDPITPADQVWRFYRQTLSLPLTDVILNRGGAGSLDLLKTRLQTMTGSFMMKLSRAVWHTAPQNTTIDVDDLDSWIGSTNNVIAGIDRSQAANAFWQPPANFPGGGIALTQANAELAYQSVVFGYDEPDLMIFDQTRFANFKNQFTGLIRFTQLDQDTEALQAGFRYHFLYNNAVVMADRFTPANSGYIVNTKYIFPVFHEADYFNLDPFIKPSNQRVITSSAYLTWQISCVSPRMNIKVTNIS